VGAGRRRAANDHARPFDQTRRRRAPLGIGPTKTGNRRDVEMTDLLVSALHRHRKRPAERRLRVGPHWTRTVVPPDEVPFECVLGRTSPVPNRREVPNVE
jgi:hypothetical protein